MRCRSAFKLKEIQNHFCVIRPGQTILDLGCAPGGWSQIALAILKGNGRLMGIDLLQIEPLGGMEFYQGDILELATQEVLHPVSCDVILSDMAPSATGHKVTDRLRMEELLDTVWTLTQKKLNPEGALIAKVFHGDFSTQIAPFFGSVQYVKPLASRPESREIYIVARDFKGERA